MRATRVETAAVGQQAPSVVFSKTRDKLIQETRPLRCATENYPIEVYAESAIEMTLQEFVDQV